VSVAVADELHSHPLNRGRAVPTRLSFVGCEVVAHCRHGREDPALVDASVRLGVQSLAGKERSDVGSDLEANLGVV
jgi:hypothetical protein